MPGSSLRRSSRPRLWRWRMRWRGQNIPCCAFSQQWGRRKKRRHGKRRTFCGSGHWLLWSWLPGDLWNLDFSRLIHTIKDSWCSWLTAQAFLVAVALCLQSLRQRFSWMRVTEPVLDRLSSGPGCLSWPWLKLHFYHLLSSAQVMTFKTGSSLYRTRGLSWSYLLQVRNRPSILNHYCLEELSQVIKASFLFFWRTHKRSFKSYQSRHEACTMCSALND